MFQTAASSLVLLALVVPFQAAKAETSLLCSEAQIPPYLDSLTRWVRDRESVTDVVAMVAEIHHRAHSEDHRHRPASIRSRVELQAELTLMRQPWSALVSTIVRFHDPRALLPLVALHVEVHELQLQLKRWFEAAETRQAIEDFAAGALGRPDHSPELDLVMAQAYTAVGLSLMDVQWLGDARQAFATAFEWNRDDPVALLNLAAIEEKLRFYPAALVYLDRLLEIRPNHHEGRLRRALIKVRMGQVQPALEVLPEVALVDSGWISAVAYQEWAQLVLTQGAPDRAQEIVAEGRRVFPADSRIALLELFLAGDRTPQSYELVDRLTGADPDTALAAPPASQDPRSLYDWWWTDGDGEEARRAVISGAAARLPFLEEALSHQRCLR